MSIGYTGIWQDLVSLKSRKTITCSKTNQSEAWQTILFKQNTTTRQDVNKTKQNKAKETKT